MMTTRTRLCSLLGLAATLAAVAPAIAQSPGEANYKAKCQSCHGADGNPNPSLAKLMGIKPVSDPDIQKLTPEQMAATVKDGKGKMRPVAGLSDAEIKDVVAYYRSLKH
jgi:mono/diheme cytochrome c family protein